MSIPDRNLAKMMAILQLRFGADEFLEDNEIRQLHKMADQPWEEANDD